VVWDFFGWLVFSFFCIEGQPETKKFACIRIPDLVKCNWFVFAADTFFGLCCREKNCTCGNVPPL